MIMQDYPRRDFLKHCGIGLGVVMTSNLWLNELLANPTKAVGETLLSNYFGFTKEQLKKLLEIGLSRGGEFAELYFEYRISNNLTYEEDIVKSASENIMLGVGTRVIKGNKFGYGYTSDLSFDKIKEAFLAAAAIADSSNGNKVANLNEKKVPNQFYSMQQPVSLASLEPKIDLIRRGYHSAKAYDSKITRVTSSIADEMQYILIVNSEGLIVSDVRPQVRLVVSATAEDGNVRNTGRGNAGGRVGLDFYEKIITPEQIGYQAAEEAVILLKAKDAPPGEMQVVLSKDESGVMIHEAVGHPLEADGAWKKTSIMWDKLGQLVANPIVTIYDDATIKDLRGTLNIDDEGVVCDNVMLIEKGKLVGFLNDKLSAKILNHKENGHGRRQSYMHPPIPRMNNTVLAKGDTPPEEIIQSVKKGFYAVTYQGGMVSGTGKFTFSVNLGYMIENGRLTYPVKNATLIGTNIDILKEIDMVGNDMGFFLGTCGKDGQSVPVTCGTPTLRINRMTVGGVA
jgi:TldD protein